MKKEMSDFFVILSSDKKKVPPCQPPDSLICMLRDCSRLQKEEDQKKCRERIFRRLFIREVNASKPD